LESQQDRSERGTTSQTSLQRSKENALRPAISLQKEEYCAFLPFALAKSVCTCRPLVCLFLKKKKPQFSNSGVLWFSEESSTDTDVWRQNKPNVVSVSLGINQLRKNRCDKKLVGL